MIDILILILAMYISFTLGEIHRSNKILEKIENEIDDEEVEKMVGGTD